MATKRQLQAVDFCAEQGFPTYDPQYGTISGYLSLYLNKAKISFCEENFSPKFDPYRETEGFYIDKHYSRAQTISNARRIYKWASLGYAIKEPNWKTLSEKNALRFSKVYRTEAEEMYSEVMYTNPDLYY